MQSVSRRQGYTYADHSPLTMRKQVNHGYDQEAQKSPKIYSRLLRMLYSLVGRKSITQSFWLLLACTVLYFLNLFGKERQDGMHVYDDPFARIPAPNSSDRLTAYATWTGSTYKEYLRHFIESARNNADMMDVVFLNRKGDEGACVDFEANNVHLQRGSNFYHVCIDDKEWTRKHAQFFCSSWSCTEEEYNGVVARLDQRLQNDVKNSEMHPFLGQVFGQYNPSSTPYWAWTDVDLIFGRMSDFPFNILSTVSFLITSNTRNLFMHGQFTAFNANDGDLATAWMREGDFVTPTAFIESNALLGEEHYWSRAYLRSTDGHAGTQLSWAAVPYKITSDRAAGENDLVISGRDVLLMPPSSSNNMAIIRSALNVERTNPSSVGVDLSTTYEDFTMAKTFWWSVAHDKIFREGIETIEWLSTIEMKTGYECIGNHFISIHQTQCLPQHVFELVTPASVRPSYIRQKGARPGLIHRHYELLLDRGEDHEHEDDAEARKQYTKAAFVHFLILKHKTRFPEFSIDADKVMIINPNGKIAVYSTDDDEFRHPLFDSTA